MAIQARTRLATRVVNHRGGGHAALSMQASGPMAGLAPSLTRRRTRNLESGVGAGSKHIGDGLMAISTDLVSNVASSLYLRRPDHRLLHRRPTACPKGNKQQTEHATVHGLEKLIHASFFIGHGLSGHHGFTHVDTHGPVQALATHQPTLDDYTKSDTRIPRPS